MIESTLSDRLDTARKSEVVDNKALVDPSTDPSSTVSSSASSTSTDERRPAEDSCSSESTTTYDESNRHEEQEQREQEQHQQQQQEQEQELYQQQQIFALTQLARQLEYYFSYQNLCKDTYLQTLRDLNDGGVPVTILANFAKIKAILPYTDDEVRAAAVLQAATEFSDLLEVVAIDTATGKPVVEDGKDDDEEKRRASDSKILLTIATTSKEPLSVVPQSPVVPPKDIIQNPMGNSSSHSGGEQLSPFNNTIILRDVSPEVTEDCVRQVFDFQGCPPIQSVHLDVANCWFVSLDCASRQDMLRVMLHLRSESLAGEPIFARIKSTPSPAVSLVNPDMTNAPMLPVFMSTPAHYLEPSHPIPALNGKKKKKKNRNSKKGKSNNNSSSSSKDINNNSRKNPSGSPKKKSTPPPPPPTMCEEHFPTLHENKVVWDTTPVVEQEEQENSKEGAIGKSTQRDKDEDDEDDGGEGPKSVKTQSDAASTATTTSTSTDSGGPSASKASGPPSLKGGYAAALLSKNSSSAPTSSSSTQEMQVSSDGKHKTAQEDTSKQEKAPMPATSNASTNDPVTPSWGRRRSFAEVLQQQEAAAEAT